MTDLDDLMKQAKLMQEQMQKTQQELAEVVVTGESGAGLAKVTMNGKFEVSESYESSRNNNTECQTCGKGRYSVIMSMHFHSNY